MDRSRAGLRPKEANFFGKPFIVAKLKTFYCGYNHRWAHTANPLFISVLAVPLTSQDVNGLIVVSITQQLKFTIFDRFQLAVKYLFYIFEIKAFRSIIAVLWCFFSDCYSLFDLDIMIQALRNYCITQAC